MPNRARWQHTWRRLQAAAPPERLFEELIARYCESHRRYHTVQHLDECFEKFGEIETQATHAGEIELALWFHDAFYDPRRQDNESKSADWARSVAVEAGLPAIAADRIHALVMATVHEAVPSAGDQRILVDVDLSILGAPQARFDEYEGQVREEYEWVPLEAFRNRRRAILEQFLARPSIFGTPTFIDRYEGRARRNLERSIARLSALT